MVSEQPQNKKPKKRKKKFNFFLFFTVFVVILGLAYAIYLVTPGFMSEPFYKYMGDWQGDRIEIIIRDEPIVSKKHPVIKDEEIFFPIEFVKERLDPLIFWDNDISEVTITTKYEVIRMKPTELSYFINDKPYELKFPIYMLDGSPYLPYDILKSLYKFEAKYHESTKIVTVDFDNTKRSLSNVTKENVALRAEPDKKAPILKKIASDETLFVYEDNGEYTFIRTSDGIIGYVATKNLTPSIVYEPEPLQEIDFEGWKPDKGKLNMSWDMLDNITATTRATAKPLDKNLDVISPTWFLISDYEGNIKNIADKGYVNWAHENGIEVWALLKNTFEDREMTHEVLSDANKRRHIIKQIISFVELYDLDGINIDLESVPEKTGPYYIQFIREISPLLREMGIVVSVDMYVPAAHTVHYGRKEIGEVVDYFMIMAYDEHWGTSPIAGSVASLPWVKAGIENTLKLVPAEKIVLGLPYYMRVWEIYEENGQSKVKSRAYGMESVAEILSEYNVALTWDEKTSQYYGEYRVEGSNSLFKVWVEDSRSIEEKVKLVEKYNLAGISGWRRGFETQDVWYVLKNHLKQ